MGAWITYALGSENENLPAFVAIPDPRGIPQSSGQLGAGAARHRRFTCRPKSITNKTDLAARDLLKR